LLTRGADWILEGGAIDGDGSGTVLTTEQCLAQPQPNSGMDRADVEAALARDLGFLSASSGSAMAWRTTIPTGTSTISPASWPPAA
jgi:hypothetical protein